MPLPRVLTVLAALIAVAAAAVIGYLVLQPPAALLENASFDRAQISPNADGVDDLATITYSLSRPARITIYLENAAGERYYFRENERRIAGDYRVYFSGVVDGYTLPDEDIPGRVERRLMPRDDYTWVIEALDDDSETVRKTGSLTIVDADSMLPVISVFEIHPQTFTPNQDGIRDRVSINIYLEKAADLSVYLEDAQGEQYFLPEREEGRERGAEGSHEFDYDGGVDQSMEPPQDGAYTVYAVAQDDEGQRIVREGALVIDNGGLPQVEIVPQTTGATVFFDTMAYDARFYTDLDTPGEKIDKPAGVMSDLTTLTLMQNDLLVFKLTVSNYGSTPIRTAGPFPGTVYNFDQRAASLGEYEQSGAWRIGISCDTAYSDFPWRWAVAPLDQLESVYDDVNDETYYYLPAGQQAEVWGAIRMTDILEARNPQDCWAGLIHEDVEVLQSRIGAREIEIIPLPGTEAD